jgi:hypothetical protein
MEYTVNDRTGRRKGCYEGEKQFVYSYASCFFVLFPLLGKDIQNVSLPAKRIVHTILTSF